MPTIYVKPGQNDYTSFEVSAKNGHLYGAAVFDMEPAGTNLPASCYVEFSNGLLFKVVSLPTGKFTFVLVRGTNKQTDYIEELRHHDKGEFSFATNASWVMKWNDYPPHRDEILKAIEGMAQDESRIVSMDYKDIQDFYYRFHSHQMAKFWEKKINETASGL